MRWWWLLCGWFVLFWGRCFAGATRLGGPGRVPRVGDLRTGGAGKMACALECQPAVELPELAEDALQKAFPCSSLADAPGAAWTAGTVVDRRAETTRYLPELPAARFRRWRLDPFLRRLHQQRPVVLGQNFDNYADALSPIQRFSLKIAERDVIGARCRIR